MNCTKRSAVSQTIFALVAAAFSAYPVCAQLAVDGNELWFQGGPGIDLSVQAGDDFGGDVTAGDFNGDGFEDLAIGISRDETLSPSGNVYSAGAVVVLYGDPTGLGNCCAWVPHFALTHCHGCPWVPLCNRCQRSQPDNTYCRFR